jgi:hypothetical protein
VRRRLGGRGVRAGWDERAGDRSGCGIAVSSVMDEMLDAEKVYRLGGRASEQATERASR